MSRRKKPTSSGKQQPDSGNDSGSSRMVIQLGAAGVLLALLMYLLVTGYVEEDSTSPPADGARSAAAEGRQAGGEEPPTAPVTIEPIFVNFGEVAPNTTHTRDVTLTNNGATPVRIIDTRPSCPCTKVHRQANTINPGASITFSIEMDSESRVGPKSVAVNVMFAGYEHMRIPISATVVEGPA